MTVVCNEVPRVLPPCIDKKVATNFLNKKDQILSSRLEKQITASKREDSKLPCFDSRAYSSISMPNTAWALFAPAIGPNGRVSFGKNARISRKSDKFDKSSLTAQQQLLIQTSCSVSVGRDPNRCATRLTKRGFVFGSFFRIHFCKTCHRPHSGQHAITEIVYETYDSRTISFRGERTKVARRKQLMHHRYLYKMMKRFQKSSR